MMRRVLGDTLRGIGVNEDSTADILLAATEACTNAVLHAGQSAAAYTVAVTVEGAACRVEVTDGGQGWRMRHSIVRRGAARHRPDDHRPAADDHRLDDRQLDDQRLDDHASLAESGRGIAIMRACMDTVTLRSAPGQGTRVVLDKRIGWKEPLARTA
jgi:serine/threonine-protein kinase RsbW